MSDRCPNPPGSLRPAAPAGLWTSSYCAPCPARPLCHAADTDAACGSPAEYPRTSANPENLARTAIVDDFEFPSFQSTDRTGVVPRLPLLVISDGTLTPNVKLRHLLPPIRGTSTKDHRGNVAVLHGRDKHLHALLRHRGRLGERLASAGFASVVAPGFSTWDDHSPFEAMLAQALTARVATELDGVLPTVPTVVWRSHEELSRWAHWVIENGRRSIALHPGPLRTEPEWAWWTDGLGVLRKSLIGYEIHAYVNGPCTRGRLADVIRIWGREVTFLTQQPWATAIKGRIIDQDDFSTAVPDPDDRSAADRLRLNATVVHRCIDELKASIAVAERRTS